MKKLFITIIIIFFTPSLFAQKNSTYSKKVNFSFELFYDIWRNLPEDVAVKGISLGNSIYAMYEKQIGKKSDKLRVAMGAGITTHKLSMNSYIEDINASPIVFLPFPETINYKKSKFVINYFDLMLELRYKTPSKFRLAVGGKVEFLLDSHTTYKGEQLEDTGINETIKYKDIRFVEKIIFGPSFKIGYGFINLTAYYSLSNIFIENLGPQFYPISVGIILNPF